MFLFICFSHTNTISYLILISFSKTFTDALLISRASARDRIFGCVFIYHPWERYILHPVRICFSVAGVALSEHDRFLPNHWLRLCGVRRHHKIDQIKRLILPDIFLTGLSSRPFAFPTSPISSISCFVGNISLIHLMNSCL